MPARPNVCRRRLAADMRQLRAESELTIDDVAEQAGISKSALSRIETGKVTATIPVVRSLLQVYHVSEPRVSELLDLAKEARTAKRQGWWQSYSDVLGTGVLDFIRFEAEAVEIWSYESYAVPGILQSEDYASAILHALPQFSNDVGRRVEARKLRQNRIEDLRYWSIIDEVVLRRPLGGYPVLRAQLEYLLEVSRRSNITIQILPISVEAHPGIDGPFVILKFAEDDERRQWFPDVAYVEFQAGQIWLDNQDDVNRLSVVFNQLRAAALSPELSRRLIEGILKDVPC